MTSSISISPRELEKLRNLILSDDLKRSHVQSEYELLRIDDGPLGIIVYKSGKLVHNDTAESKRLVDSILEKETGFDYLLGTDEVGKGEWYGPLVVVCAALTPTELKNLRNSGVRDSKLLRKPDIERLAKLIVQMGVVYRETILMPEVYNARYVEFASEKKTLNDLLAWAHAAAIRSVLVLIHSKKLKIIIDKFDSKKMDLRLGRAGVNEPTFQIIQSAKGDTEVPVSVSSILAKHIFEQRVDQLSRTVGVDLRTVKPETIDPEVLPTVAKAHFKNIRQLLPADDQV